MLELGSTSLQLDAQNVVGKNVFMKDNKDKRRKPK